MMLRTLPLALLALAACSPPGNAAPTEEAKPRPTARTPRQEVGSHIIGKTDFVLRGKPACRIDFAYAGKPPENLFWEEPCAAVTAMMIGEPKLQELGRWDRLDEPARKFVAALPAGQVLYVEGSASASVYPVGTTGTYEVAVAD